MDIPYTTDVRPDTGVTNPALGMWLFLASEVMLFGGLFSSYALLRAGAGSWPDQSSILDVPLGSLNTLVLIASSVTTVAAVRALRGQAFSRYRLFMGLTILCSLLFLGIKGYEYADKLAHGLLPSTNNFLGLYFTLTGLHAAHVLGGLLVNLYLWGPGARMWVLEPARFAGRVRTAALYWYFVDIVWIVMFVTLYLL